MGSWETPKPSGEVGDELQEGGAVAFGRHVAHEDGGAAAGRLGSLRDSSNCLGVAAHDHRERERQWRWERAHSPGCILEYEPL